MIAVSAFLILVFIILLYWVYLREITRPENYYGPNKAPTWDSGATMRSQSESTTIDQPFHYNPASAKDPRFFTD
jgi:hypothetical protein